MQCCIVVSRIKEKLGALYACCRILLVGMKLLFLLGKLSLHWRLLLWIKMEALLGHLEMLAQEHDHGYNEHVHNYLHEVLLLDWWHEAHLVLSSIQGDGKCWHEQQGDSLWSSCGLLFSMAYVVGDDVCTDYEEYGLTQHYQQAVYRSHQKDQHQANHDWNHFRQECSEFCNWWTRHFPITLQDLFPEFIYPGLSTYPLMLNLSTAAVYPVPTHPAIHIYPDCWSAQFVTTA